MPSRPRSCRASRGMRAPRCHRAKALDYAEIVLSLVREKIPYDDRARAYATLDSAPLARREPRPYQREALAAWKRARGRGVVVLPTGAGKTHVATMAIDGKRRSTLVVVPTLDLVRQWYDLLARRRSACQIGVVGGGDHDVEAHHRHHVRLGATCTWSTSATASASSSSTSATTCRASRTRSPRAARASRRFASASPRRPSAPTVAIGARRAHRPHRLPPRHRRALGRVPRRLRDRARSSVALSPEEREEYDAARGVYRGFVRDAGHPHVGARRLGASSSASRRAATAGRSAMRAYRGSASSRSPRRQARRTSSTCCTSTGTTARSSSPQDNATVYVISRRFLVPVDHAPDAR